MMEINDLLNRCVLISQWNIFIKFQSIGIPTDQTKLLTPTNHKKTQPNKNPKLETLNGKIERMENFQLSLYV